MFWRQEMKKVIAFLAMIVSLFLLSLGANLAQEPYIKLNRPEMESLLCFFNEASVRGADIETWATLGQKLKTGAKEVAVFVDTTQVVSLPLNSREAKICIDIINDSTFQAKWVELVYSIKRKLQKAALADGGVQRS
jgi:hypothetical protein